MTSQSSPQTAPATALAHLIKDHPELPPATWSLDMTGNGLRGYLQDESATFDALRAWAVVIGGSVAPGTDYTDEGRRLRPHRLTAVWRGVHIVVSVVLPLPSSGQLAEQRVMPV